MKKLFPILLLLVWTTTGRADDQTRRLQSALSEAGFYNGTADGKMGEETRAALRRFQIRNGLDVTGSPTPETLVALKIPTEPAAAAADDEERIAAQAPTPETRVLLPNPEEEVVPPPAKSPIRDFFANTDLSDASGSEQSDALETAQRQLIQLGYFRSAPNGLPGPEMETALLRFQHAQNLRLTGRLDSDTRQALVDTPPSVPSKPFRSSKNRPPGVVLRGVWIR